MKQFIAEVVKFCDEPEHQVATLEWSVGGNNAYKAGGRNLISLVRSGMEGTLRVILQNGVDFSCEKLQRLRKIYGHEFVEKLVETAYRILTSQERPQLKAAYEGYCTQAKKPPADLDGLLFNDTLRTMLSSREATLTIIDADSNLSPESKKARKAQFEERAEQNFQTWLNAHKEEGDDGSVTINLGHITIMVNVDQLGEITLRSVLAL